MSGAARLLNIKKCKGHFKRINNLQSVVRIYIIKSNLSKNFICYQNYGKFCFVVIKKVYNGNFMQFV